MGKTILEMIDIKKSFSGIYASVSYTHLTLPTMVRV